MDTRILPENQLSAALHYLQLVIVEKGAATDELQASNQELKAILEGLLTIRDELRSVAADDGSAGVSTFIRPAPDPGNLDLPKLKREADLILKKGQAIVQESILLRMRSKKVRAALVLPIVPPHPVYDPLSKRERQVLMLIVAGKSSKEIAVELGISFKTAVTHRASIMSKMEVHEIASVVREAIRRGLA
jgi:DNA-binding CsgD family transcriptional regulator